MSHTNVPARRRLLRTLTAAPVIGAAAYTSGSWVKPVIQATVLPAHAQTSATSVTSVTSESATPVLTNVDQELDLDFPDDYDPQEPIIPVNVYIPVVLTTNAVGEPDSAWILVQYVVSVGTAGYNITSHWVDSQGTETVETIENSGGILVSTTDVILVSEYICIIAAGIEFCGLVEVTIDPSSQPASGAVKTILEQVTPVTP